MGRVEGKVAFITGAARGQGRSHAVRLAQEGADIIAVDICQDMPSVPYPAASESDLAETVKQVEQLDRRIIARPADVRDLSALQQVVDEGLSEFGHIDVVSANAGILSFGNAIELDENSWQDVIDVNLTGVWKTVRATAPAMVERGQGGYRAPSIATRPPQAARQPLIVVGEAIMLDLPQANKLTKVVVPPGSASAAGPATESSLSAPKQDGHARAGPSDHRVKQPSPRRVVPNASNVSPDRPAPGHATPL
jgi:NAD(P)-dependent dehydrogenase (short-subunit alcohol dehydrogenase family)